MKYVIKKFHVYENGIEKVLTTDSFESGKELSLNKDTSISDKLLNGEMSTFIS